MTYIREIKLHAYDIYKGDKIQHKNSGNLLIYLPKKRDQNISKKK